MPSIFRVENLICQLVSGPAIANQCSWRQWAPIVAACLAALAWRAIGAGRLTAFAAGVALFFLVAIGLSIAPLQAPFVFAQLLFLAPLALSAALLGLIGGDLCRYLKRRLRATGDAGDADDSAY